MAYVKTEITGRSQENVIMQHWGTLIVQLDRKRALFVSDGGVIFCPSVIKVKRN